MRHDHNYDNHHRGANDHNDNSSPYRRLLLRIVGRVVG